MKRWQTLLIGLVISAVALVLAFRQADFNEIIAAFQTARYEFMALTFGVVITLTMLRGWRWSVLTQGRLLPYDCFWLFNVGFLFNNVLPVRLGELARAVLAGRRPKMHFTSALSSIVVERLFDMVSVVILLGIVLVGLDLPGWATAAGATMGGGALLGIAALAYAARRPDGALKLGARVMSLAPGITRERATAFLEPFIEGLGGVSNLRTFALGLVLSVAAWLGSGLAAWLLMHAFWQHPPIIMGQLAVAAAGLGLSIPSAPSGLGPFHAAVIGVFTAVGYDADISRSYAFTLHAINFSVTTLLGILGLLREGASFGEVARAAHSLHPSGDEITDSPVEIPQIW